MKILIIFLALCCIFFTYTSALSCTHQWECSSVSQDYNYVECKDSICQCRSSLGFDGSATSDDRCRCDPPNKVYWDQDPYCLSFDQCSTTKHELQRTEKLKQIVKQIYDSLIFPIPALIISGNISIDHIFSPNAKGRVDPLGTYDSKKTLVEYFYGLAITPTTRCIGHNIKYLEGVDNKVFIRIDITFEEIDVTPSNAYNLTQTGRYLFDDQDRVVSTELIIHNIGKQINSDPSEHPATIQRVCGILLAQPGNCVPELDPEGHYTSFQDCVDFLTNQVPFGTFDQAFSDTVACRTLHALLTIYDPEEHCKHAGKTGGGKCINVPYEDYYLVDY